MSLADPREGDLMNVEAAARLRISHATLARMVREGTAPPSFKIGRRRYFPADQLERWIAERRAGAQ